MRLQDDRGFLTGFNSSQHKRAMKNNIFGFLAACFLLCPVLAGSETLKRVGVLLAHERFMPAFQGFKQKMADLGYIEGKNIVYDFYNANGDPVTLSVVAEKFAKEKPDLVVVSSSSAALAIANATKRTKIPIVFLSVANPLQFARSYASSGNNFTGVSTSTLDLTEKRIELLKEVVPGIKRAISVHHIHGLNYESNLHAIRSAGKRFALDFTEFKVASPDDLIQRASTLMTRKYGDAVVLPPDPIVAATQKTIFAQLTKERLPAVGASIGNVQAGALVTYAADYFALGQQGAMLGDNILKGANPRDLPIQFPSKLKLVVNLKTAKEIGLKLSREILVRADEVIE